jgi:hypothetical protein
MSELLLTPTKENNMSEFNKNTNNEATTNRTCRATGGGVAMVPLFEFSFSSLSPVVAITSATVELYYYSKYLSPAGIVHRFNRLRRTDWDKSTSTWNIYKTGSNWGTAPAANTTSDIFSTNYSDQTVPANYGWVIWDVTDMLNDAIIESKTVLGLRLMAQSGASNYAVYYGYNWADSNYWPILRITYETVPIIICI